MGQSLFPTRRQSVHGIDFDGNAVRLTFSISKKLYRCPGCGRPIPIGSEHVVVQREETSGTRFHQHWHSTCSTTVIRDLKTAELRPV